MKCFEYESLKICRQVQKVHEIEKNVIISFSIENVKKYYSKSYLES